MGANLIPKVRNFSIDANFVGDQHEIDDGCVTPGTHKVLRFDFVSQNVGDADFVVGRPIDRPDLFYYSAAHHHFHMKEFNQYKLYNFAGDLVIPSKKPGFCLADVEQVPGMSPGPSKFRLTCRRDEVMGISAGWADVYEAHLECQYLVIDGVPDGDYVLVATTNTGHAVPEDNFDDNTVCKGLHIEGNSVQELPTPAGSDLMGASLVTLSGSRDLQMNLLLNDHFPLTERDQISPPFVCHPIHECSKEVYVYGFVAHATVKVYANGTVEVVGQDTPWLGYGPITLNRQLRVGETITATQTINGLESVPSYVSVQVEPAPTELKKPTVGPDLFECGRIVEVSDLVASVHVEVFETPTLPAVETPATRVGQGDTMGSGLAIVTSPLKAGQFVTAEQISCLDQPNQLTSPPSDPPVKVKSAPNPMPSPTLDPPGVPGSDTLIVRNLFIGADLTILDTTTAQQIDGGLANASANIVPLFPPVGPVQNGHSYQAVQTLCTSSSPTQPQGPSERLSTPILCTAPICAGTRVVTVVNTEVNAVVNILRNGNPKPIGIAGGGLGDVVMALGGGATFQKDDVITVIQYIGGISSRVSNAVRVIDCTGT